PFPVSVDPVKAILRILGWVEIASPVTGPLPGTTLTTPSGIPASLINCAAYNNDKGVCSAGLIKIVHPVARAAPIFHEAMFSGKFHGIICPTTPIGSCTE